MFLYMDYFSVKLELILILLLLEILEDKVSVLDWSGYTTLKKVLSDIFQSV